MYDEIHYNKKNNNNNKKKKIKNINKEIKLFKK